MTERELSELSSSTTNVGEDVSGRSILIDFPVIVVIGDSSYRIEFMNTLARKAFGNLEGERCHKIFRDSDIPCRDCLLLKSKTPGGGDSEVIRIKGLQNQTMEMIHQRLASDPNRWILIGKSADLFLTSDVNYKEIANALDVMGDGVAIVDLNGKIVYANKAYERMHGYSLKELVGADISIFYPPDLKEETANKTLGEADNGGWGGIVVNARKDGSKFLASLKTAPLHDVNGAVVGYLGIVRDVSEMWDSGQALQEEAVDFDYSLVTRALLRTSFDLQAAKGVPDIHTKVADRLLEIVPYDAARLYGVKGSGVVVILSRNFRKDFDLTAMESDFQEIAKKVLRDKKGWSGALMCKTAEEEAKSFISLIAIPMIGREDEVGAIVIARAAERTFTDQDREIATIFANNAAIALENALLSTRENKMLDESIQRVRQLESILDLTTSVMSVDSQEEAVKKVLSAMTSVLGFNRGLILKMSENSGELECSHSTGFLPREMMRLERVKLPMSDLVSIIDGPGKLVGDRTILLSDGISHGHHMDDEKLSAARRVMSNLHLEYPGDRYIITIEDNKGELIGVIMLAEATDGTLGGSQGTINLLEIYGNLASIAINNARLFEMEIAARGEVETLNDLMTHDINNFIQGVLGYLDMIGNDESISKMQREYAQKAIEQIEGTKRLIENVRKLAWIKTGYPEKISPYDLGKVIGESLTHVMETYPNKNLRFSSTIDTEQFFVMGDEMIPELFINLISNSVKFTPSQDVPIELGIKTQVEIGKEFWRIEIVDHGRGIPEDKKQFVFERFGKQDYTPYGFGLGLSICRNLTRKYGGRIWVENRVPEDYRKGSRFVILLPKLLPQPPDEDTPRKRIVRKMREKSSKGTSFSRVLKQPQPGQSAGGKASADEI